MSSNAYPPPAAVTHFLGSPNYRNQPVPYLAFVIVVAYMPAHTTATAVVIVAHYYPPF